MGDMHDDFYRLPPEEQAARLSGLAQQACLCWDLGTESKVSLLKCRENAVFRLDTDTGRYVMRVHRADYHTPQALDSELR